MEVNSGCDIKYLNLRIIIKDLQAMSDDDLLQVLSNTEEQINSNYYHITKGIFRVQSNENFLGSLEDACN